MRRRRRRGEKQAAREPADGEKGDADQQRHAAAPSHAAQQTPLAVTSEL
jgi:hypothetical protein